jgi:hypothetical protein
MRMPIAFLLVSTVYIPRQKRRELTTRKLGRLYGTIILLPHFASLLEPPQPMLPGAIPRQLQRE